MLFRSNDTATTEIYTPTNTLSLHDALPISGNVEMRYDPDQQRVIYQPVTIEPREITPRIVREENYADVEKKT